LRGVDILFLAFFLLLHEGSIWIGPAPEDAEGVAAEGGIRRVYRDSSRG
jgi:hypothetical protein